MSRNFNFYWGSRSFRVTCYQMPDTQAPTYTTSVSGSKDGRLGCALVDWLPRADRREQTHYLSWILGSHHMSQGQKFFKRDQIEVIWGPDQRATGLSGRRYGH